MPKRLMGVLDMDSIEQISVPIQINYLGAKYLCFPSISGREQRQKFLTVLAIMPCAGSLLLRMRMNGTKKGREGLCAYHLQRNRMRNGAFATST